MSPNSPDNLGKKFLGQDIQDKIDTYISSLYDIATEKESKSRKSSLSLKHEDNQNHSPAMSRTSSVACLEDLAERKNSRDDLKSFFKDASSSSPKAKGTHGFF